jgi:hypothetical protein
LMLYVRWSKIIYLPPYPLGSKIARHLVGVSRRPSVRKLLIDGLQACGKPQHFGTEVSRVLK